MAPGRRRRFVHSRSGFVGLPLEAILLLIGLTPKGRLGDGFAAAWRPPRQPEGLGLTTGEQGMGSGGTGLRNFDAAGVARCRGWRAGGDQITA